MSYGLIFTLPDPYKPSKRYLFHMQMAAGLLASDITLRMNASDGKRSKRTVDIIRKEDLLEANVIILRALKNLILAIVYQRIK